MEVLSYIWNNWYIILTIVGLVIMLVEILIRFAKMTTEQQMQRVREWLRLAVTRAESQFVESGTGSVKLRSCYELFIKQFPTLSALISFAQFSELVDEALSWMHEEMETKEGVRALVEAGIQ